MINFRLFRVVAHFLIINVLFFLTYKLRLFSEVLPLISETMPFINAQELAFFSLLSSMLFVGIGVIKGFYPLHNRIINHFQKLSKVWGYWFITIAFLSYFGQGFVFLFGISRFIILISVFLSLLAILFFDQVWRKIEYRKQQTSGKKILIITEQEDQNQEALETIKSNFSLPTEFKTQDEVDGIDFKKYEMCVVVGTFSKQVLQSLFEKTRMNATRFFHISE